VTTAGERYGFAEAARMEWIKLRSLRSTWWLVAAALGAMVAAGAGVGFGYRGHTPTASMDQIVDNSLGGAVLAQLFVGALGVMVVTGEYSSGTIRSTLAAVPRRGVVLAAKAAVQGATAAVVGLVASLAGFVAGQLAIAGTAIPPASLGDGEILRAVLLTGVYLGAIGLIGVGIGAVVRHTGGAVGTLFGLLFVPMIMGAMFGQGGIAVARFVPLLMLLNSIAVRTPVPGTLPAWGSTLVMCLYAAVAVGLGAAVLRRRDA